MTKRSLVIEGRQRRWAQGLERLLTAAGWLVAGVSAAQAIQTVGLLQTAMISLALAMLSAFIWVTFDRWRQRSRPPRMFPMPVSPDELAAYFGLPLETVQEMQRQAWIDLENSFDLAEARLPRRLRRPVRRMERKEVRSCYGGTNS